MEKIIIIGAGGHAHASIDVIEQCDKYSIVGLIVKKGKLASTVFGYPVLGTDQELKKMVEGIRKIVIALGNGIKKPSASEKKNIKVARNSIVAAKDIKKGEKFTDKNLGIKRPGHGISPMKIFEVTGKIAKKNFIQDELIKL